RTQSRVQPKRKPPCPPVRTCPPSRSSASRSVHAFPSSRAHASPANPPPITRALPPRRISTRLYHETRRRFVGGGWNPMLAWPESHERDSVQRRAPRPQTSLRDRAFPRRRSRADHVRDPLWQGE